MSEEVASVSEGDAMLLARLIYDIYVERKEFGEELYVD